MPLVSSRTSVPQVRRSECVGDSAITIGCCVKWLAFDKPIEAKPRALLYRVPADPPSGARVVIPIPVIKQVRLIVLVLGREPEGVGLGHGAGGAEDFPEGAFEASPWVFAKPLNLREMRGKRKRQAFRKADEGGFVGLQYRGIFRAQRQTVPGCFGVLVNGHDRVASLSFLPIGRAHHSGRTRGTLFSACR